LNLIIIGMPLRLGIDEGQQRNARGERRQACLALSRRYSSVSRCFAASSRRKKLRRNNALAVLDRQPA
jgi:hypothetical protein